MILFALAALSLPFAAGVAAQASPTPSATARAAPLPCDGNFVTYRVSDLKPGMLPIYEQAVRDQNAFYASHGNGTRTVVARIIEVDQAAQRPYYSTTSIATATTYTDFATLRTLPQDASYAKFIAEYRESATMRSETRLCVPPR